MGSTYGQVARMLYDALNDPAPVGVSPSPCAAEGELIEAERGESLSGVPWRNPLDLIAATLFARLFCVADCLAGISLIAARGDQQPLAGLSAAPIARAALEALAYTYWLAEPEIGHAERVRRLMVDTAWDHGTRHRLIPHGRADGVEIPAEDEGLAEMCDGYGVAYSWGKWSQATSLRRLHVEGESRPSAFDILAPLMPSTSHTRLGAVFYSLMTDVAHASVQGLLRAGDPKFDSDGRLHLRFSRRDILRGVAPTLWALPLPVIATFDYFGWDSDTFREPFASAVQELSAALSRA